MSRRLPPVAFWGYDHQPRRQVVQTDAPDSQESADMDRLHWLPLPTAADLGAAGDAGTRGKRERGRYAVGRHRASHRRTRLRTAAGKHPTGGTAAWSGSAAADGTRSGSSGGTAAWSGSAAADGTRSGSSGGTAAWSGSAAADGTGARKPATCRTGLGTHPRIARWRSGRGKDRTVRQWPNGRRTAGRRPRLNSERSDTGRDQRGIRVARGARTHSACSREPGVFAQVGLLRTEQRR